MSEHSNITGEECLDAGTLIAERYEICSVLGVGGMGSVYLARDRVLGGEEVAVKVLHNQLSFETEMTDRFLREIQLMRRINHQNVIRTYDVGIKTNLVYFTMEYAPGVTLYDILVEHSHTQSQLLDICVQICEGLEAIHSAKIIHRDLKPENIIVLDDTIVKITDFGVARPEFSTLTAHNEIIGSSPYIAPEIWLGAKLTHSADLYSLGVLFYELFTGVLPFDTDAPAAAMHLHLNQKPLPTIKHNSEIPSWLNRLILRLLSKTPAGRPLTAAEVANDITASRRRSKSGPILSSSVTNESSLLLTQLEESSKEKAQKGSDAFEDDSNKVGLSRRSSSQFRLPSRLNVVSRIDTHRNAKGEPKTGLLQLSKQLFYLFGAICSSAMFIVALEFLFGDALVGATPTSVLNLLKSNILFTFFVISVLSLPGMAIGAMTGEVLQALHSFVKMFVFNLISGAMLIVYYLFPVFSHGELDADTLLVAASAAKVTLAEIVFFSPMITTYEETVVSGGLILHSSVADYVTSSMFILILSVLHLLMINHLVGRNLNVKKPLSKIVYIVMSVGVAFLVSCEVIFGVSGRLHSVVSNDVFEVASFHFVLPVDLNVSYFTNWGFVYLMIAFLASVVSSTQARVQRIP